MATRVRTLRDMNPLNAYASFSRRLAEPHYSELRNSILPKLMESGEGERDRVLRYLTGEKISLSSDMRDVVRFGQGLGPHRDAYEKEFLPAMLNMGPGPRERFMEDL